MTTRECSFAKSLFILQMDPDLLEDQEWKELYQHLENEPPCQFCFEAMDRNADFVKAHERFLAQRNNG